MFQNSDEVLQFLSFCVPFAQSSAISNEEIQFPGTVAVTKTLKCVKSSMKRINTWTYMNLNINIETFFVEQEKMWRSREEESRKKTNFGE